MFRFEPKVAVHYLDLIIKKINKNYSFFFYHSQGEEKENQIQFRIHFFFFEYLKDSKTKSDD